MWNFIISCLLFNLIIAQQVSLGATDHYAQEILPFDSIGKNEDGNTIYSHRESSTFFSFNENTSTFGFGSRTGSNLRPDAHVLITLLSYLQPKNVVLGSYFSHNAISFEWSDHRKERRENFHLFTEALPNLAISSLDLDYCNLGSYTITDDEMMKLLQILPQTDIEELSLLGMYLSSKEVKALSTALPNSKIKRLNVHLKDIQDEYFFAIGEALPNCLLEEFKINSLSPSPEALSVFAAGVNASNLKKLNLDTMFFRPKEMEAISVMVQRSTLRELYFNISHDSMDILSEALKGSKLKKLKLSPSYLGNQELIKLIKGVAFSELEEIDLSGWSGFFIDQKSDMDEFIAALSQCTHLKKIDIGIVNNHSDQIANQLKDAAAKCNIELLMLDRDTAIMLSL